MSCQSQREDFLEEIQSFFVQNSYWVLTVFSRFYVGPDLAQLSRTSTADKDSQGILGLGYYLFFMVFNTEWKRGWWA